MRVGSSCWGLWRGRECSVEELAALLHLKAPTISHHLTKLKDLNLVNLSPQGNTHLYRLNLEQLEHLSRDLPENERKAPDFRRGDELGSGFSRLQS